MDACCVLSPILCTVKRLDNTVDYSESKQEITLIYLCRHPKIITLCAYKIFPSSPQVFVQSLLTFVFVKIKKVCSITYFQMAPNFVCEFFELAENTELGTDKLTSYSLN